MRDSQAIVILLLVAPAALAQPASDPWAQVPALPVACYSGEDGFQDQAYAAAESLQAEKMRQDETNQAISQQLIEMDIMEQQQRMMDYMMANPQDAQRYMEAIQQTGQQVQEQMPEMMERSMQFEAERQELTAAYDAALSQAITPVIERREGLYSDLGSEACTEEHIVKAEALIREENAAYETVCASWWKEGPFHTWFAEFKAFQIETATRQDEQAGAARLQYEVMGIEADQYRPTGYLGAPIEYLRLANLVFSKRQTSPIGVDIGSCGDHG